MKDNREFNEDFSGCESALKGITNQLYHLSTNVQKGMARIRIGQEFSQKARQLSAGLNELEKVYHMVKSSRRLQLGTLLCNIKVFLSFQRKPVLAMDRLGYIFRLYRDYLMLPVERNVEQDFYFFLALVHQIKGYFTEVLGSNSWQMGNTIISALSRSQKAHIELSLREKLDVIFDKCLVNAPRKGLIRRPTVSVIIPVYNKAAFLNSCLESLLTSGYEKLEIVCIDDKSTDESVQILQMFASRDSRVTVFLNETNRGASASRNLGIQYSTGKYLFFLDADDIVAEDAIESMVEIAEDQNSDIVRGKITGVKNSGDLCTLAAETLLHNKSKDGVTWFGEASLWYYWYFTANLYSADFIKDNCIIFPTNLRNEDPFFLCRCFLNAKNISLYNEVVYYYRIGAEQKSKTPTLEFLTGWSMGNYYIYQLIQNHDRQAQYFMVHFPSLLAHSINTVNHLEKEQAKSLLIYIKLIFKNADLAYYKNPEIQPWYKKKNFSSEYIEYVVRLKNDPVSSIYNYIKRGMNASS